MVQTDGRMCRSVMGPASGLLPPLLPRQQAVDSPSGQEQDAAYGQVSKKHEEPHSRGEGIQEGEVARLAPLWGEGDPELP